MGLLQDQGWERQGLTGPVSVAEVYVAAREGGGEMGLFAAAVVVVEAAVAVEAVEAVAVVAESAWHSVGCQEESKSQRRWTRPRQMGRPRQRCAQTWAYRADRSWTGQPERGCFQSRPTT